MKSIKVTCAIITDKDRILACQNNEQARHALQWEFPGGKIEPFETEAQCIVREIKEELNIDVQIVQRLNPISHNYPEFKLELIPFEVKIIGGQIMANAHKSIQWIHPSNVKTLNWAETDQELINSNLTFFNNQKLTK